MFWAVLTGQEALVRPFSFNQPWIRGRFRRVSGQSVDLRRASSAESIRCWQAMPGRGVEPGYPPAMIPQNGACGPRGSAAILARIHGDRVGGIRQTSGAPPSASTGYFPIISCSVSAADMQRATSGQAMKIPGRTPTATRETSMRAFLGTLITWTAFCPMRTTGTTRRGT